PLQPVRRDAAVRPKPAGHPETPQLLRLLQHGRQKLLPPSVRLAGHHERPAGFCQRTQVRFRGRCRSEGKPAPDAKPLHEADELQRIVERFRMAEHDGRAQIDDLLRMPLRIGDHQMERERQSGDRPHRPHGLQAEGDVRDEVAVLDVNVQILIGPLAHFADGRPQVERIGRGDGGRHDHAVAPAIRLLRNSRTSSMNRLTRAGSTWFSKTPSTLKWVPTMAPSAMESCSRTFSRRTPVLANTTVSGTRFFTFRSSCESMDEPAVSPETHRASGRLLNTVDLTMLSMSRVARYTAASGPMLNSSLTSFACSRARCRAVCPTFVFHSPKSLA